MQRLGEDRIQLGVQHVPDEAHGPILESDEVVTAVLPCAFATPLPRSREQPAQCRACLLERHVRLLVFTVGAQQTVRLRTLTEEAPSPELQVDGIVAAIYARPFLRGLGRYCTE